MATVLSRLLDSIQRVVTPDECILASFIEARQVFYKKLDACHKSGAIFAFSYQQLRAALISPRLLSAKQKKRMSLQRSSALPSLLCS